VRVWLLLPAVALLLAPTAAAAPVCSPPALEAEIMCPTCEGQTLDQSQAPSAQRVKAFIRERSSAGDTCGEIKAQLVDDFGERILAAPPRKGFNLLAWLLPVAGLAVGALAVAVAAWRWSRSREPEPTLGAAPPSANGREPVDSDLERRLDEELARFE
jgi:cytochrome c-type biogenesis protein CcmH